MFNIIYLETPSRSIYWIASIGLNFGICGFENYVAILWFRQP